MRNNKIKIPVERLKEIIQEEVSKFYDLPKKKKREVLEEDDIEEAIITGASEAEKQAAVQATTDALRKANPDDAVARAVMAGVSVPLKGSRNV